MEPPRMKKLLCCGCKSRFAADTIIKLPAGNFHSIDCASAYATAKSIKQRAQALRRKEKDEKKAHTKRKRELKDNDKSFQIKKTQQIFNAYIRLRDNAEYCISCGRSHDGQYHAGHYRSVGSCPELRFNDKNCHKQCAPCNNHLSGNLVNYRVNLLAKFGVEFIDFLEGPHEPKRYTIQDLKELQVLYSGKIKELEQC